MLTKSHKNMTTKTITAFLITMATLIYSNMPVLAEPPSTYKDFMGPGLLDYLQTKIQTGYFVETFTKIDLRYKARVDSRNTVEKILTTANQATPISTHSITSAQDFQKQTSEELKKEVKTQTQRRENNAATELASGFKYIPSSNGMITYFKDGMAIRIVNEPVKDEFGNISLKNTDKIQYNDKRLRVGYEATLRDKLGNTSKITWSGRYSDDSVHYGTKDTRANKSLLNQTTLETDSSGNTKRTIWEAIGGYDGKFIRAYHERIEDSVYGTTDFNRSNIQHSGNPDQPVSYQEEGTSQDNLPYTINRINTTYNEKGQTASYREIKTIQQIDGTPLTLTIEKNIEYLPVNNQFGRDVEPESNLPLRITTSILSEYADGAKKNETSIDNYEYNGNYNLTKASSYNNFSGQEAGWIEFSDGQGHILTKENATTYSYINSDSTKITVSEDQVIKTSRDGNKYAGATSTVFEIAENGNPEIKSTDSTISYYGKNISPDEIQRVEHSTSVYDIGMVMYTNNDGSILRKIQRLGRTDRAETKYPLLDPDNTHMKTQDLKYEYKYDGIGNLNDLVLTSGIEKGWDYASEKGWHGEHTSVITERYDVILGKPVRKEHAENINYN